MTFEKRNGQPVRAMLRQLQAGQVLLIVVLVIVVASTIGLSLVSRSITSLRTSTEEAESQKALAAAEAGIERQIQSNSINIANTILPNGSNYSANSIEIKGTGIPLSGGNMIQKNGGIDIWFEGHNADGTLDGLFVAKSNLYLYWGSSSSSACSGPDAPAAIQTIVVTVSSGVTKTYRYVYDSCNRGNNFTLADSSGVGYPIGPIGGEVTFKNRTPIGHLASGIPAGENIVFIRAIPLYKDSIIGVSNDNALPLQGYQITSTGTSGQANRKIRVFKGWPQTYLPYLSYGLFVVN